MTGSDARTIATGNGQHDGERFSIAHHQIPS
jgi:hypothetical protein